MDFEELNAKYNTEFTNRLLANKHIFYEIYEACGNRFWGGCGSYLFDGQTYKYCDKMYPKQELLYNQVKDATSILEIGTYMGHSLFIMLLANPGAKITCIDISDEFTRPAVEVLNRHFNNAITFIHSDSLIALEKIKDKFDFFHIDGHHENDYITTEFNLVKRLNNRPVLRVLFDDQATLARLQEQLYYTHTVIKSIKPDCDWNNIYFELAI
jgi:hypothetical protein